MEYGNFDASETHRSNNRINSDWQLRYASLPAGYAKRYTIAGRSEIYTVKQRQNSKIDSGADAVALYHIIYEHEGFEDSAQNLFKLVQQTQSLSPGKKRKLYLDIEGHRVKEGGFDDDMLELQKDFLFGFLSTYLSEIYCPLFGETKLKPQKNDIPADLILIDGRNE